MNQQSQKSFSAFGPPRARSPWDGPRLAPAGRFCHHIPAVKIDTAKALVVPKSERTFGIVEIITIGQILKWGTTLLSSRGIDSSQLDTEVILASILGMDRTELFRRHEEELPEAVVAEFERKIARRGRHEPVAYITGMKEFWSLPFKVGPGVLIPRPETELLVEIVKREASFVKREASFALLDVGTGAGNIAVTLAHEFPNAKIDAIDQSDQALSYAKQNASIHGVSSQINFTQENLHTFHASRFTLHDLIVSNPPYIASAKIGELDPTIREFEPVLALDGGKDGLDFFRLLAKKSSSLLKPGGVLAVEIGEDQGKSVPEIFLVAGFTNIEVILDYSGLARVITASSPLPSPLPSREGGDKPNGQNHH